MSLFKSILSKEPYDWRKYTFLSTKERDALFADAGRVAIQQGNISAVGLQREFIIGNIRAMQIMHQLAEGKVLEYTEDSLKKVPSLMSLPEFEWYLGACEKYPSTITKYGDRYLKLAKEKFHAEHPNHEAEFKDRLIQLKEKMENIVTEKDNTDLMTGEEFEDYCADLLQNNGFDDIRKTTIKGDHGIDLLAKKDGISYAIQCKCYSSSVGNKAVQEAYSGKRIYDTDIAAVMTNSFFTPQAISDAQSLKVKLWDRDVIKRMK